MKRELRTRFDIMRPDINGKVTSKQAQQKLYDDQHSAGRELFTGQRVMVRNFRAGEMGTWNHHGENWSFIVFGASSCGNVILIN